MLTVVPALRDWYPWDIQILTVAVESLGIVVGQVVLKSVDAELATGPDTL